MEPTRSSCPPFLLSLPPFISPLPNRIPIDDLIYLEKQGALTIPEPALCHALLHSYVENVHAHLPLLDLQDLIPPVIANNNGACGLGLGKQISLLLFQTVMFAGSTFVDMPFLYAAGYTSRKAAQRAFFERARVSWSWPSSFFLPPTSRLGSGVFDSESGNKRLVVVYSRL